MECKSSGTARYISFILSMAASSIGESASNFHCANEITLVHDKAPPGLIELCNLWSGCDIEYKGLKYSSAMGIFAGLHCDNPSRFSMGAVNQEGAAKVVGDLTNTQHVLDILNEHRAKPLSTKDWEKKNTVAGNLAKIVLTKKRTFNLNVCCDPSDEGYFDWSIDSGLWFSIFEAKYKDEKLRKLLLATKGQIVFFNRFADSDSKFSGKMVDNKLVGKNIMGKLLTNFRDSLVSKKRKREDDEAEVIMKKTRTAAQVVADAFKKAQETGAIVDLTETLSGVIDDLQANVTPAFDDYLHAPNATGGIAPQVEPSAPALGSPAYIPSSPAYSPNSPAYAPPSPTGASKGAASGAASSGAASSGAASLGAASSGAASSGAAASGAASSVAASGAGVTSSLGGKAPDSVAASGAGKRNFYRNLFGSDEETDDETDPPIDCTAMCVTFSDAVESDRSGLAVGEAGDGFTLEDLEEIRAETGLTSEMYRVQGGNQQGQTVTGYVLVLRSVLPTKHQSICDELCNIPRKYVDTKMWSYGSCKNKSRWNTNLTDNKVKGDMGNADPQSRHPSEFPFAELPALSLVRRELTRWACRTGITGLMNMIAEVNYYGITPEGKDKPSKPPGIGWHIDGERKKVAAMNVRRTRKFRLAAYDGVQPLGPVTEIKLYPGDMYILSSEASGTSYRGLHIRHCASAGRGNRHYLAQLDQALLNKLRKKKAAMEAANKPWQTTSETDRMLSGQGRTIQNILC